MWRWIFLSFGPCHKSQESGKTLRYHSFFQKKRLKKPLHSMLWAWFSLFHQISWVRIRDWHILTNGLVRFTTDDRFNVLYKEGSFNWILQVSNNSPPHIKAGHSLPIFEGEEKEGEIFCGGRYFPILALRVSRNCPKCSRCWKCAQCKDTISSDPPSLSHSFMRRSPIFFSVFYAFHLFTPECRQFPLSYLARPAGADQTKQKVNNCPKKHPY